MRLPIKFNRAHWPTQVTKFLPSAADPRILCTEPINELEFTRAVSTFKFGSTFKSTQKKRFPLSIMELAALPYQARPIIIDAGASDGITSLDVMQAVPYEKYYVTDLNIQVTYHTSGDTTWFYDEKGACILIVTDRWVSYPDTGGAIFPFDKISQAQFSHAPSPEDRSPTITLINPLLLSRKSKDVFIERYNVLEAWPHEKADLIIAANILNRAYFTASEIEKALNRLIAALNDMGRIAIIDNRPSEKTTIFQISQGVARVEKRVNGGTEIEALAMNIFSGLNGSFQPNKASPQV